MYKIMVIINHKAIKYLTTKNLAKAINTTMDLKYNQGVKAYYIKALWFYRAFRSVASRGSRR